MKRELIKSLALIAILIAMAGIINIHETRASQTLVVPDKYSTIGAAVNQASAGDTVFVKSGIYNENVQVDKPLTLEGQNSTNTVIIGSGGSSPTAVLVLAADAVKVSGFTIESLNYSKTTMYAYGIWVEGNNCTITGNIIENTYTGIFCSTQTSITITQNTVKSNFKNGICFYGGSQNNVSDNNVIGSAASGIEMAGYSNVISKNNVEGNFRGVGLGTIYSVLFGNNIVGNTESGIFLAGSKNIISANNIQNNKYGVFVTMQLTAPLENRIYHNNFLDNRFNAFDNSSALIENWDNGAKSGGNFWSDYLSKYPDAGQADSSGFGSRAYVINSGNEDNYPLIKQFETQNLGNPPAAIAAPTAMSNSVVASWSFDTVEPSLVSPDATGNNPAILGSETPVYNNTPALVQGKFGGALNFTGNVFATVQPSPSLLTPYEVTIDAWVNVQAIKAGVAYNNIFIEAVRTTAALPTRLLGLAVNGQAPTNSSSPAIGALRGYVVTPSGLNEIDTLAVLPNDTWVHVVFTRSTTTGMHLYINGKEQAVTVGCGTNNPTGPIRNPTDIYIGHDSKTEIENLQISNTVEQQSELLWMQWWLWAIVFAAVLVAGLVLYSKRARH
ncbi:MAG: NosD domain-containing protein [Candidatus Bathyarchaeia archaeon]|jgi:parallel beta-helix repeat protein